MRDEAIRTHSLTLSYHKNTIIDSLDISFIKGHISVIVGPNGCGKSTLLKGLGRILKHEGDILLNHQNILELSTREIAKQLAFLPQDSISPEDSTVREVVSLGRYPYKGLLQKNTEEDEKVIDEVLIETGLNSFANENIQTLSGGQKQRVWIATALCQQTEIILLDEPTTYLDLGHQIEILNLLKKLNKKKGITVIMVLHDLNLAARFSDYMIGIKSGKVHYQGRADEIMTPPILEDLFGIKAYIGKDPIDETPICLRFE
ncbi:MULTISPECIES: ABC transporter ATP-binding protein [Lactococcus]|uniref:ABC transporter ATP-binding protein n=1 Tax=Lactococcus TaxID=1357 RepID=UPI00077694AE|nr:MULTISPECIES: ABC transporter ATP-binding protein [Lactococcus]KXT60111.1 Ferrichrome transport ATP-binding protein FhuC [Lactococcus sp. DD01]USI67581.1 ABC transporter ATP-binding protein [Lactococcus petauri]WJE12242.1 ABC transporter ATP-binding protein [Lactococcus petauri]